MILLSSLLFCLLMYVIPGVILTDWCASWLSARTGVPVGVVFMIIHVVVYGVVFIVVKLARITYEDFNLGENRHLQATKEWLRGGSGALLGMGGIVLIGAGVVWMVKNGLFPMQLIPLIAASMAGLLTFPGNLLRLDGLLSLPDTRYDPSLSPPSGPGCIEKQLSWSFSGDGMPETANSFSQEFCFSEETYKNARKLARFPKSPLSQYLRYITDQRSVDIKAAASQLRLISIQSNFTTTQEAENIVALVRSIPYKSDQETHQVEDYANFPIETFVELMGDCEDHGILAAAILFELGHQVGLYWLDLGECGHIALAYHAPEIKAGFGNVGSDGRWYHYVETVPCDANERVGELSLDFRTRLKEAKVLALV